MLKGAGRVYIYYSFLLACILRKSGIAERGRLPPLFSFVSICRRSFGGEICVVTAFCRLSGILSASLFLRKLGGIFGFIWPFVSIYHGFNGICGRLSDFLRLAKGLDGRDGFGRSGAFLGLICGYVFFLLYYIYYYIVRALRGCVHIYAYACINMQMWCRRCRRCRRCRQEKTPLPCRRCRRGV